MILRFRFFTKVANISALFESALLLQYNINKNHLEDNKCPIGAYPFSVGASCFLVLFQSSTCYDLKNFVKRAEKICKKNDLKKMEKDDC